MQKASYEYWNQLVYFVSSVYSATYKIRAGNSFMLAGKIRKTAISLSACTNNLQNNQIVLEHSEKIYPVISSINVLETYLQLAKKDKLLKEITSLEEELKQVKHGMYHLYGEKDLI